MSGTTTTATPVQVAGSFFYDNTVTVAAAMDLQTALQTALPQALAAQQAAAATLPLAQQAVSNANYFLSGNLQGLPTVPGASGTLWNNGGEISIVS